MIIGPSYPTSVPIWRQAEVLKIIKEEALEGFVYFCRVREKKSEKYEDYVQARRAAMATLNRLAAVAAIVGEECAETWLAAMEERARTIKEQRDQGRAA